MALLRRLIYRQDKWLAEHYASDFPKGAACVGQDFYIDYILTGANTVEEAMKIHDETIKVLRAGFRT